MRTGYTDTFSDCNDCFTLLIKHRLQAFCAHSSSCGCAVWSNSMSCHFKRQKRIPFVVRSILLFAARALKYNKPRLWLLNLKPRERTVEGTLENSITLKTAEREKLSFLLCMAVKMALKLFIHTQLLFCEDNRRWVDNFLNIFLQFVFVICTVSCRLRTHCLMTSTLRDSHFSAYKDLIYSRYMYQSFNGDICIFPLLPDCVYNWICFWVELNTKSNL